MSQDLIFGFTKKNWSRTVPTVVHECGPEMCTVSYRKEQPTDDERARLAMLAEVKMKAESGDGSSRRQWKAISKKMVALRVRARRGDPGAKHALAILEDSGLFGHVQKIAGSDLMGLIRGVEDKDQDIIDRLILRTGNSVGWPVYISSSQYADYKARASKKDSRATAVLAILDRYAKEGRLKIGDDKKGDYARYPIGNEIERKENAMSGNQADIIGRSKFLSAPVTQRIDAIWSRAANGQDPTDREKRLLRKASSKGNVRARGCLAWLGQRGITGAFVGSDEVEVARDGGACERAALTRLKGDVCGIVISDQEIKDSLRGSLALVGGRRRHRRHLRRMFPGQMPGQFPGQIPGQSPYQSSSSTYVRSRDSQKSQIVRNLYRQIKREHINWMINQDRQNGIYNQTADKYQQAAQAWARSQLQQQQLPTRFTASGTNQWYQPVSWFQSQAQTVLNNTSGQRAVQVDTSISPAASPYAAAASPYPLTSPYPAPASSAPSNAYYPSSSSTPSSYPSSFPPGEADDPSLYDDEQGSEFVGDEARAEGEDSSSCGDSLPHEEYRALIMKQAIRNAGGNRPGTKHLFAAKKAVDSALGKSGVSIYMPGAGPARRTV